MFCSCMLAFAFARRYKRQGPVTRTDSHNSRYSFGFNALGLSQPVTGVQKIQIYAIKVPQKMNK